MNILTSLANDAGSYGVFAKNVSLVAMANALVSIRGIFFIPIIAKQLGEAPYGIWTQIMLFVTLASSMASLGLGNAITRFLSHSDSRSDLQEGFYSALVLVVSASLLAVLITRAGLWIFSASQQTKVPKVVNLGVWLIPLASLEILCLAYFTAKRRMKVFCCITVLKGYGEIAFVYAFVALGSGLLGAVQASMIMNTVITAALLLLIIGEVGLRVPRFEWAREYLAYSLPTLAITLSLWLLGFCDRYIIRLFSSNAAVGIYSAAYSLGRSVNVLLPPLIMVLNPTIFTLWERGEKARAQDFQTKTLKLFLFVALPATAGISFLSKPILNLLATARTADLGWVVVPLVSSSTVLCGAATVVGQVFLLHKDTKTPGLIWAVAAVANVATNFVLVPLLELLGAALAALISYGIALLSMTWVGRRYREHWARLDLGFLFKALLACFAMVLGLYGISTGVPVGPLGLLVSITIGCVAYFAVVFVLKGLGSEEIAFIKSVLRGQFPR